jgi:hemerythrin-like metal-binding protein
MKKWHLPDWLYNALPYLYGFVGLLTIALIHNGMAIFSSLLFISAGCMVWMFRYKNRNSQKMTAGKNSYKDSLVYMNWQDSFMCGHHIIDEQHRRLFCIGNELITSLLTKKPKSDIELILDNLANDIENHFRTEEDVLAKNNHPISDEHKGIHRYLLAKAAKIQELYHIEQASIGDIVGFICYDVVAEHIIKEDLKLIFTPNSSPLASLIPTEGFILEALRYCTSHILCKHNLNGACLNNTRNCLFRADN